MDETADGSLPPVADVELPLAGRVALVTGGARGQGRSHAVGLARLGADIAICDLGRDLQTVSYPLASPADLEETNRQIGAIGRRCESAMVDVRSLGDVLAFVDRVVGEFGSVDILVANAGISTLGSICTMSAEEWSVSIDTNLTGVFNAMRAVSPHMRRRRWGRIVGISSMMGRSSNPGIPGYVASKWGIIGLVKSVAQELAPFDITVNAIAPGNVSTGMIHNEQLYRLMRPDLAAPSADDVAPAMTALHVQPVPWIEPEEVTAAVAFLCSDGARHITGAVLDVSAGASARFTG
ncbi:MAG: mycofactocin-coupled SDR family oxidoreductase [Acidimicrobiales bacterium]